MPGARVLLLGVAAPGLLVNSQAFRGNVERVEHAR